MPDPARLAAMAALRVLSRLLSHIPPGGRSSLARHIMRDRFNPNVTALAHFSMQALHAWHNRQYAVDLNGEAALLARLRPFSPAVVFDVGANVGAWSLAALHALPDTRVHAFEIPKPIAAILARNTEGHTNRLIINHVGLGRDAGEVVLYTPEDADTAASIVHAAAQFSASDQRRAGLHETRARVIRGDSYMADHGIERIDMLKIDVEGAEFQVLDGFSRALSERRVTLVQFEYGKLNLSTREFLGDFWRYMTDRGFVVGKLYPEGVAFKDYDLDDENFLRPNYIACLADRPEIIAALRCPHPTLL